MKKWIIASMLIGMGTCIQADELRDDVQAEILKHLQEVEQERAEMMKTLEVTVREVETARKKLYELPKQRPCQRLPNLQPWLNWQKLMRKKRSPKLWIRLQ